MQIYDSLKKDHEEIKDLLDSLLSLNEDDDYRFVLIAEIKNALIPHSRAEESVFYNTLRAINADKGIVLHGFKEHMEAETLLRTLQLMDKMNMDWKGVASKLKEAVFHHIEDEENDIFAEAQRVLTIEEAELMGDAFANLKVKVQEQSELKNTMDMVVNMMPPRIADKLRNLGDGASRA